MKASAKPKADSSFAGRVRAVVRSVPRGAVISYEEVARRAGVPRAARAVGRVLAKNFDPAVPCHRVIRKDGLLGGYNRGSATKKRLLELEGYRLKPRARITPNRTKQRGMSAVI
jgi:O-6-methylguanine DNA methyltransferase